jgi:hypothetical protein
VSVRRQTKERLTPLVGEVYADQRGEWTVLRVLKGGGIALHAKDDSASLRAISAEMWAALLKSGVLVRTESKTLVSA